MLSPVCPPVLSCLVPWHGLVWPHGTPAWHGPFCQQGPAPSCAMASGFQLPCPEENGPQPQITMMGEGVTPFPGLTIQGQEGSPSSGQGHAQPETPFLLSTSHPISSISASFLTASPIHSVLPSHQPCLRLCILRNWAYDNLLSGLFQGQG